MTQLIIHDKSEFNLNHAIKVLKSNDIKFNAIVFLMIHLDLEYMITLTNALKKNKSILTLRFEGCNLTDAFIKLLANSLKINDTLITLKLIGKDEFNRQHYITYKSFDYLSEALKNNLTLQNIHFNDKLMKDSTMPDKAKFTGLSSYLKRNREMALKNTTKPIFMKRTRQNSNKSNNINESNNINLNINNFTEPIFMERKSLPKSIRSNSRSSRNSSKSRNTKKSINHISK
jgi:hypothetical protein